MRPWMPLATAVVITWPIPSSAAPATRVLPPSLATAAASYDHAQVVGDRVMLERLLADDYLLVNGAAERESKRQLIADLTDSNFHLEPFRVEDASQVVWSDGAVLAGEVHLTGLQSGKPFKGHIRFADVAARPWAMACRFHSGDQIPERQVGSQHLDLPGDETNRGNLAATMVKAFRQAAQTYRYS